MDKRQFTGKTLEEAISEAAKAFSTGKDLLCYNVIQQSSGSLFSRLFSRSVRIEAWVETVKEDLQAAAREVVRQTLGKSTSSKPNLSPLSNVTKKDFKEITTKKENHPDFQQNRKPFPRSDAMLNRPVLTIQSDGVQELFEDYNKLFFAAFGVSTDNIEIIIEDNEAIVRVSDEGIEKYLSKSDKLSLAFEHVFKRVAQRKLGDISSRISLDAGESSEKREERLIGMARSLAEKVRKTGKSVILSSKSSQERRVIHLALDGFVGVATRSVGTGDKRRLVIYSTEKRVASRNNHNLNSQPEAVNKLNPAEKPQGTHPSKFRKKPHKKRLQHSTSPKQNAERVGAVTSSHDPDDEEMKQVSNKRQSYLIKED
jgi:spoIIIJ-associated protein